MRHASWVLGLGLACTLALAAARADDKRALPAATRDVTVCIYKALKSASLVHDVTVYADAAPYPTLVEYRWRVPPGGFFSQWVRTTIAINSSPDDKGWFHYAGAIGAGNNVIDGMKDQLASTCHAEGGFVDQDFFTDGLSEIDMSQYVN
jgi:hypothetical protein